MIAMPLLMCATFGCTFGSPLPVSRCPFPCFWSIFFFCAFVGGGGVLSCDVMRCDAMRCDGRGEATTTFVMNKSDQRFGCYVHVFIVLIPSFSTRPPPFF